MRLTWQNSRHTWDTPLIRLLLHDSDYCHMISPVSEALSLTRTGLVVPHDFDVSTVVVVVDDAAAVDAVDAVDAVS